MAALTDRLGPWVSNYCAAHNTKNVMITTLLFVMTHVALHWLADNSIIMMYNTTYATVEWLPAVMLSSS